MQNNMKKIGGFSGCLNQTLFPSFYHCLSKNISSPSSLFVSNPRLNFVSPPPTLLHSFLPLKTKTSNFLFSSYSSPSQPSLPFNMAFYSQERKQSAAIQGTAWTSEKQLPAGAVAIDKCWRWLAAEAISWKGGTQLVDRMWHDVQCDSLVQFTPLVTRVLRSAQACIGNAVS